MFNIELVEKLEGSKKAIKFLNKKKKDILDDIRCNETLASLYVRNNQKPKAIDCLNEVLAINPYNEETYRSLLKASELDAGNKEHH